MIRAPRARAAWFVVGCALVVASLSIAGGCPGKDGGADGKRVLGAEGRERWVVQFGGPEPDLTEYRALKSEASREAYAEKMRSRLKDAHADVEVQVAAIGGQVVEAWWMSNAITGEIEPGNKEAGRAMIGKLGVRAVTPDAPLAD